MHRNNADPKVLAYKYLETLPHLAKSGNTFWVIPGELVLHRPGRIRGRIRG